MRDRILVMMPRWRIRRRLRRCARAYFLRYGLGLPWKEVARRMGGVCTKRAREIANGFSPEPGHAVAAALIASGRGKATYFGGP